MSETPTREQFQAKIDRAHAVRIRAEQFFNAGEDMNSREALLIGIELSLAGNDLAGEFGYPAPVKPR
jgi:hypothetical protein